MEDLGQRFENFVACHLLKAVDLWTECGFGNFGLHYIRDKEKNDVDFLVTRDEIPWFLVETKLSGSNRLSSSLKKFAGITGVKHAFQVVHDLDFVNQSCFETEGSVVVPAKTFLSHFL